MVTVAKQHKVGLGIGGVVAILLVVAAAYGIYALLSRSKPAPFQNFAVSKATQSGKATRAAISPDGKYLLYVVNEGGQQGLWLQNIPTNSNTQVVAPGPFGYLGLRFSPDGNYLYFLRTEPGSQSLKFLYRAPVLGGTPQKLVTDIDSNITLSPDGKKFAYLLANNPKVGEYRVIVRSAEGASESPQEKTIASGPLNEVTFDLAWSPDGKVIVMPLAQPEGALGGMVAFDAETGKRTTFLISKDLYFVQSVWLPDGSGLLASGTTRVHLPESDLSCCLSVGQGVAGDARHQRLCRSQPLRRRPHHCYRGDANARQRVCDARGREQFTGAAASIEGFPPYELGWTRDGQLIMSIVSSGVTLLNPESGAKTPLFSQVHYPGFAHSCPDGHLVFMAAAADASKIEAHIFQRGCRWRKREGADEREV